MRNEKLANAAFVVKQYLEYMNWSVCGQNVARALKNDTELQLRVGFYVDPKALMQFPESYYAIANLIKLQIRENSSGRDATISLDVAG